MNHMGDTVLGTERDQRDRSLCGGKLAATSLCGRTVSHVVGTLAGFCYGTWGCCNVEVYSTLETGQVQVLKVFKAGDFKGR